MKKVTKITANVGCLISVVAPLTALVLYPRAKWLFAFVFLGIAIVITDLLTKKDLTPQELADFAERIFSGHSRGMDVDNYEHLNPRDSQLRELWQDTMAVGGWPEEWVGLDEVKKRELLALIQRMRTLDSAANTVLTPPPRLPPPAA